MQFLGHGRPVAHVAQPGAQRLPQHQPGGGGGIIQWRQVLLAEQVQQSGVAVHDHGVQLLLDEHRVPGERPGTP